MSTSPHADDLTKIKGIGPKLAQALAKNNVTTFVQVAALDGGAIVTLEASGDFKGNNDWQSWISEAKKLVGFAADETSKDEGKTVASVDAVDIDGDLPADTPEAVAASATIVVKAKPEKGRWRAGRHFGREATEIPYLDLSAEQRTALRADRELVVTTRVRKP